MSDGGKTVLKIVIAVVALIVALLVILFIISRVAGYPSLGEFFRYLLSELGFIADKVKA